VAPRWNRQPGAGEGGRGGQTTRLYSDRVDDAQHRGAGFYLKQGYAVAATIDCELPGLTRYYMVKKL